MSAAVLDAQQLRELVAGASPLELPIRRMWAARLHRRTPDEAFPPAEPLPVGATRHVAIETEHALASAQLWLHTFGSTTAECRVELVDRDTQEVLAAELLHPVIDRVWYELRPSAPRAGSFELRVTALAGTVAPALEHDGAPAWQCELLEFLPLALERVADTVLVAAPEADAVVGFELPWVRDGYSVAADDGVAFDTIVTDGGRYVPAQQLKRIAVWPFPIEGREVSFLAGDGGFSLAAEAGIELHGSMSADSMVVTARASGPMRLGRARSRDELLAPLPRFSASDAEAAERLTRFYRERALSWPFRDYTASAVGWKHWLTRMLSWTDTDGRAAQAADLAATAQDADGLLWTRTDSAGWPFPDPTRYETRHPSASLSFVAALGIHYSWTADDALLIEQLPRARRALDAILDDFGVREHGLLVDELPDQDGTAGSLGTHYWDIVPGGARDAYANVLLLGALRQAARMERHVGESGRAAELDALAARVGETFRTVFWDDRADRFIQNIDVAGHRHDYGSSYLNLEALAAGLGSDDEARRVLEWLDTGRTELTDRVLLAAPSGPAEPLASGVETRRPFEADALFASIAAMLLASPGATPFTLRLRDAAGAVVAERALARWWDRGWAALEVPEQPAGRYELCVEPDAAGLAWQRAADGADGAHELSIAVVSAHRPGPADIYSAWRFAPRASTRRNDFWYTFGWSGVETDYGDQVQDGGTALYISGFDIEARARLSADDAWERLLAILERAEEPDRLCGGGPLSRGERPQAMLPGQVGVDVPFPESGLAPNAVLPAFFGLDPRPEGLVIRPNLPGALEFLEVDRLRWRDTVLRVRVEPRKITVTTDDVALEATVEPGGSAILRHDPDGRLELHHPSTRKDT